MGNGCLFLEMVRISRDWIIYTYCYASQPLCKYEGQLYRVELSFKICDDMWNNSFLGKHHVGKHLHSPFIMREFNSHQTQTLGGECSNPLKDLGESPAQLTSRLYTRNHRRTGGQYSALRSNHIPIIIELQGSFSWSQVEV